MGKFSLKCEFIQELDLKIGLSQDQEDEKVIARGN